MKATVSKPLPSAPPINRRLQDMPSPAQHVILARAAAALDAARHGEKKGIIRAAAAEMGVAEQTVHKWLSAEHRYSTRKRRSDAGKSGISVEEMRIIAAAVDASVRNNGKQGVSLEDAVARLRADGKIDASRIDEETGEVLPLSTSAISRAMKQFALDAKTLRKPSPHVRLRSLYPNHVWQLDASVAILYYLEGGGHMLVPTDKAKHYKNKLHELKAIELFRVQRYLAADHTSHAFLNRNYPGSESGAYSVDMLAWAMAKKENPANIIHGRPTCLMVDPGATASNTVRRFCDTMGIDLIVNKPGNSRAKGSVEVAQNIWERAFESWLLFIRHKITGFDELNAKSEEFAIWFNNSKTHSRTGDTRFSVWSRITKEQLIETASYETLKSLADGKVAEPRVTGELTVRFNGQEFPVRHVPGIVIGRTLTVAASPFVEGQAMALVKGDDGRMIRYPLEAIARDSFGFPLDAPVIREEYKAQPDTIAEKNRKAIDQLLTGENTVTAAETARAKKGFVPFGGELNPFVEAELPQQVIRLPRVGTPMPDALPEVIPAVIPTVRAAKKLMEAAGDDWRPENYDWLVKKYPDGIPEDVLDRLIENTEGGNRNVATG